MSWRRFVVLLAGLSPTSLWRALLVMDAEAPRIVDDPDEAERLFQAAFK